jgi:SAM-dependent methyltransferase
MSTHSGRDHLGQFAVMLRWTTARQELLQIKWTNDPPSREIPKMSAAPDFAVRRFQSAAAHYSAGRAPYPAALIARTVELLRLDEHDRIMDLGCGPAQLALAFAPFCGEVLALDPEPAMLALAREAAQGVPNVRVVEGRSEDLGPQLGTFRAVTIGRAFHWMDRQETLRRFESLLSPDGAVVLFGDDRPRIPENGWVKDFDALLERYSSDDEDRRLRKSDGFVPHTSVLLDSPFNRLEQVSIIARHQVTLEGLIARALSRSSTSRARLGARADELIAEIHAQAANWSPNGVFTEVLTSSALIARR